MDYRASKTGTKFHRSNKFLRALLGPVGSGKSVACVMEILIKANQQEPFQGVRRSRWAVVRNSYRELLDTSQKTFHQWIPKDLGEESIVNATFTIKQQLDDGTRLECEVLFRALDKPADVKKLLSLDLTGIWFNEVRELPLSVVNMGATRVGRYPSIIEGGPSWFGIIMDTNPMDEDHWFPNMFEKGKCPENAAFFKQPSGLSEEAENIENLPRDYYTNIAIGKPQSWVNVYVHGKYGFVSEDNPVWSQYNDDVHFVDEDYVLNPKLPIYTGIDFGLTPAIVFGQLNANGGMDIFDEIQTFNMAAKEFGRKAHLHVQTNYRNFKIIHTGDPAGEQRAQTDEMTPYMILAEQGINAFPAETNDPTVRIEVVASYLRMLDFSGKPALRIWRGAPGARKAFAGGYKYKRVQISGEERFKNEPDKNKHSHIADATQYLMLGAVGTASVTGAFSDEALDMPKTGIM